MNASSATPIAPQARLAGLAYLIIIVGGLFAQVAVFQPLTGGGSAAGIARTIAASQPLWRLGLAANLIALVANVPLGVILYGLFKPTQPSLARGALAFILIWATIEAVNLMLLFLPLVMGADGVMAEAMLEPERQALALLAIRMHNVGFAFALLFFAGFCLLTGVIIVRSRAVPRVLGWLMGLAGVCYAVNTLAMIVAPLFWSLFRPPSSYRAWSARRRWRYGFWQRVRRGRTFNCGAVSRLAKWWVGIKAVVRLKPDTAPLPPQHQQRTS